MRPKCIVIDLDGTLICFKGGYDDLFNIFVRRGVEFDKVRDCYEITKREYGFSVSAMMAVVSEQTGLTLDDKAVRREFVTWLKRSLIVFDDSLVNLRKWKQLRIPIVILTIGDVEYQTQKVRCSQLPHDYLEIVDHRRDKVKVIKRLIDQFGAPVILIDDRPSVLDLMIEGGLTDEQVIRVQLLRQESPYFDEKAEYGHFLHHNLGDIQILNGQVD